MEDFFQFLTQAEGICTMILATILVGYALILRKKKLLQQILLVFVLDAQRELGSANREEKMLAVTTWLSGHIPPGLKPFFSEKQINTMIESALVQAKLTWDDDFARLEPYLSQEQQDILEQSENPPANLPEIQLDNRAEQESLEGEDA